MVKNRRHSIIMVLVAIAFTIGLATFLSGPGTMAGTGVECDYACMDDLHICMDAADRAYEECILDLGPSWHWYCNSEWQEAAGRCDTKYVECVQNCAGGGGTGPGGNTGGDLGENPGGGVDPEQNGPR